MNDFKEFLHFFIGFLIKKINGFFHYLDTVKDLLVSLLIVKRGKYSSSVLNTSFFLITGAVVIVGPVIAQNTPLLGFYDFFSSRESNIAFNPYDYTISTVVSDKPRDKIIEYTVQEGETVTSIAKKFPDTDVNSIKWLNNLTSDNVRKGTKLKIPPIVGVVHTVLPGETIYSIAKRYKVDPQNIVNYIYNDFVDQDTYQLAQGQTLFVPNGVKYTAPGKTTNIAYKGIYNAPIRAGEKGNSNFIWPTTGVITQYPIWYHNAYDIANAIGTPVLAAESGTVLYSDCIPTGYGCHIVVDNGGGFTTVYAHLSKRDVKVGDSVSKGSQIGLMGSTGRSTGPHLHFEIRINGKTQDPSGYLKKS